MNMTDDILVLLHSQYLLSTAMVVQEVTGGLKELDALGLVLLPPAPRKRWDEALQPQGPDLAIKDLCAMQMVPGDTEKCWRGELNTGTAAVLRMDTSRFGEGTKPPRQP